jgi:hypothetical protein
MKRRMVGLGRPRGALGGGRRSVRPRVARGRLDLRRLRRFDLGRLDLGPVDAGLPGLRRRLRGRC